MNKPRRGLEAIALATVCGGEVGSEILKSLYLPLRQDQCTIHRRRDRRRNESLKAMPGTDGLRA